MQSKLQPKVENVVASVLLGSSIPLNALVGTENTDYDPGQLPGLIYKIDHPESAAIIFSWGKVVSTGTKSVRDATIAIGKVIHKIKKTGIKVRGDVIIEVEEITASAKIAEKLNLEEVSFSLEGSEYNPDRLPALLYKPKGSGASLLLSSDGRMVCTGAKKMKDVRSLMNMLRKKLGEIGIMVS